MTGGYCAPIWSGRRRSSVLGSGSPGSGGSVPRRRFMVQFRPDVLGLGCGLRGSHRPNMRHHISAGTSEDPIGRPHDSVGSGARRYPVAAEGLSDHCTAATEDNA